MAAKAASPDQRITLAGRAFTLRFSLKAVLALQDLWGLASEEEVHARLATSKNKINDFVDVLWAAMRTHHAEMTREQVLELADEAGLDGLSGALNKTLEAAMPPPSAGRGPQKGSRGP